MKNGQPQTARPEFVKVPQHTFPDGIDEKLSRRQKRAIKRALNPKKNRKW